MTETLKQLQIKKQILTLKMKALRNQTLTLEEQKFNEVKRLSGYFNRPKQGTNSYIKKETMYRIERINVMIIEELEELVDSLFEEIKSYKDHVKSM